MSTHVSFRDGGKTDEEGLMRPLKKLLSSIGVMSSDDLAVTERGAGANKSVDIAAGDLFISYGGYAYYGWNTAVLNDSSTVITANTSGNDRIDAVVAYIDLTVVSDASSNNPDALKFKVVPGTPAGSPTAPSDGDIQTSVGASNPFLRLANVAADNGYASIVDADITDTRTIAQPLLPAGSIVQRKVSANLGQITFTDINTEHFWGEIDITPKHADSTIVATLHANGLDNTGNGRLTIELKQDTASGGVTGTDIASGAVAHDSTSSNGVSSMSLMGKFAPGNTAKRYIKAVVTKEDASTAWYAGRFSASSYIVVEEIKA